MALHRQNQGIRRRQDKHGNPRKITERIVDRYRQPSKAAYKGARFAAIEDPKIILKEWHKCYVKTDNCHVWNLHTAKGKLSLTSQNGTGIPRFGMGMLSPYKTANARAYIYQTIYNLTLAKHARLRMKEDCHEYCVNPAHMLPRPEKDRSQ